MSYLLVTSRCPITHENVRGKHVVKDNVGGVATGLRAMMKKEGGVWVCWGDGNLDHEYQEEDYEGYKIVRILINQKEKNGFYDEFSNGTLWPLFHYFRDRIRINNIGYKYYRAVNEKFADRIMKYVTKDMKIWIHDYQLTLVPGILRSRGVKNFTIFSWHIPWVASEFYAILPRARDILESMVQSNMITFHNDQYSRNFRNSCEKLLYGEYNLENKLFAYSLGIDYEYFSSAETNQKLKDSFEGKKVIFSIDRLDYTKGLTNRVLAIENLMRRYPQYHGKFVYVMVVTPSRTSVAEYMSMKRDLEMTIGRVNGQYGDLDWTPIVYMYRKISGPTLLSYYRIADIALITPLIDGLNLVSKEFVAATDHGMLILSLFAGAIYNLPQAIIVNPNDLDAMADAIDRCIKMPAEEIRQRLTAMKNSVHVRDIRWWIYKIDGTSEKIRNGSFAIEIG